MYFAYLGFKVTAESAENSETLRSYLEYEEEEGGSMGGKKERKKHTLILSQPQL